MNHWDAKNPSKDKRLQNLDDTAKNDNGKPKIFYRGMTQKPKDGAMRESSYYTTNKNYAKGYSMVSPFADDTPLSSTPSVSNVYLSLKNIFDTRKPEHKKIYKEFLDWLSQARNYPGSDTQYSNAYSMYMHFSKNDDPTGRFSTRGLPKAEIMEWSGFGYPRGHPKAHGTQDYKNHPNFNKRAWDVFVQEKGYDFDAILIDEQISSASYESSHAPESVDISIVVFDPRNVINAKTGKRMAKNEVITHRPEVQPIKPSIADLGR